MNLPPDADPAAADRWRRLVPWMLLGLALCWAVIIRIPLILNAEVHLDSDLAVDGLTLLDAVRGRWRWHYPGTPHMGIGPALLSWAQARIWGANPVTLVSGGAIAHLLVLSATFAMAWRVFGRGVASWALVPLAFSSAGTLWMSGRITGGHLTVVAWSAGAWLLFHEARKRGTAGRMGVLGLWCGLGFWLDSMFLMTLAGMAAAALYEVWVDARVTRPARRWAVACVAFAAGLLAGASPRFIGRLVDPHDAYNEQFTATLEPALIAEHGRILFLECLPRLIAGHRLPDLESDPNPALLGAGGPVQQSGRGGRRVGWTALAVTATSLPLFAVALLRLGVVAASGRDPGARVVAFGLLVTSLAIVSGFLVNRNIFNSDNARYLVLLLIPWAVGLGSVLQRSSRSVMCGVPGAFAVAIAMAVLFTADAGAWYRQLGWVDDRWIPTRQTLVLPALRWLEEHPEVTAIYGDYWDVYRLAFLTSGAVRGVPFPVFPNRFPEWSSELPGRRPETMLVGSSREGRFFMGTALREGGRIVHRGKGFTIVTWPLSATNPAAVKLPSGEFSVGRPSPVEE